MMENETQNGMSNELRAGLAWRKSSYSGALGNCVELAALRGGEIAIRNSRDPGGAKLVFSRAELSTFLRGAKNGEFEL